jgi:WD40 repeat protein
MSTTDPQMYLVDLKTLKSQPYHSSNVDWSANGKYALIGNQVLTLSDKTLRSLPAIPDFEKFSYRITDAWHPTAGARLIIYADKQKHQFLYLLDIETLTYRHLALPSNFDDDQGISITWSPNGDHLALVATDGSLWQMDYPKLENLEQLTSPIEDVKDISWSPDGRYLSYVGGTDIYIIEVESKP